MMGEGEPALTLNLAKGLVRRERERKEGRTVFGGPNLSKALQGGCGGEGSWAADPIQTWVRMHIEQLLASLDHIVFVD